MFWFCVGSNEADLQTDLAHQSWFNNFFLDDHLWSKYQQTWVLSILASCIVGLAGVVPLLLVPIHCGEKLNQKGGSKFLRLLLSFAVGGLLGDVFLHLLPEAWNHIESMKSDLHSGHLTLGIWVLIGMFSFVILELMFAASQGQNDVMKNDAHFQSENMNGVISNGRSEYHEIVRTSTQNGNGLQHSNGHAIKEETNRIPTIHITGYLNLMANSIDNFTHGLAVAGSFLVGVKMGVLTTFAILLHEIPHEIGDFAILLKSGFNPWNAAKAQMSTATIGILGAVVALSAESADKLGSCTAWILPFTSGGFLNIALVNVLPELLKEKDAWESLKQMICLCGGIAVMALVTVFTH